MGVKGAIETNKLTGGRARVHLRDPWNNATGGKVQSWTGHGKHGFMRAYGEGWLLRYGLDPMRKHR